MLYYVTILLHRPIPSLSGNTRSDHCFTVGPSQMIPAYPLGPMRRTSLQTNRGFTKEAVVPH